MRQKRRSDFLASFLKDPHSYGIKKSDGLHLKK